MGVADAEVVFTHELVDLLRVVRYGTHGFHKFRPGYSLCQLRDDFSNFTNEEFSPAFLSGLEVGGRNHDAHADHVFVDRDEPCPVICLLVEDQ